MLLITFTMIFTLFHSCDIDQVVSKYADYNSANKNDLFQKGWIPYDLAFKSMTDIYQRTNLDLNNCIFSFKLSKTDIEAVKQKAVPTKAYIKKPIRIKFPYRWIETVNSLNQFIFISENKSDSVYLAIDEQNGIVYGWRN